MVINTRPTKCDLYLLKNDMIPSCLIPVGNSYSRAEVHHHHWHWLWCWHQFHSMPHQRAHLTTVYMQLPPNHHQEQPLAKTECHLLQNKSTLWEVHHTYPVLTITIFFTKFQTYCTVHHKFLNRPMDEDKFSIKILHNSDIIIRFYIYQQVQSTEMLHKQSFLVGMERSERSNHGGLV